MVRKKLLLLLVLVTSLACAKDPVSPSEAVTHAVSDGLATQLSVDRAEIGPGEEFTATYSIHNTRSESIQLKSACGALARGVTYRDGEEARLMGSGSGCRTEISTHGIAAGGTWQWQWQITAATILEAYSDGREPDIAPAEPGEYVFRIEPDVFEANGAELRLPELELQFVVR